MYSAFHEIITSNNRENNIKLFKFTDKIPEIMSISDIVISKPGGLTSSEALASYVPMIIINPIPGQEEENAIFIENNNAGYWLRKHDNIVPVLNSILNDDNKLEIMKENTKKISKRNSTKNICEILFNK